MMLPQEGLLLMYRLSEHQSICTANDTTSGPVCASSVLSLLLVQRLADKFITTCSVKGDPLYPVKKITVQGMLAPDAHFSNGCYGSSGLYVKLTLFYSPGLHRMFKGYITLFRTGGHYRQYQLRGLLFELVWLTTALVPVN
jgi:hypothetical protein